MGLKLQEVPATAGMRWAVLAFAEYRRFPLAYAGLFIGFLFTLVIALLVPLLGGIAVMMSPPLLTLAFMLATHASTQGERPGFDALLAPWRPRVPDMRRRLLALLMFFASLMAAAAWVAQAQSAGGFDALFEALRKGKVTAEELDQLMSAPGMASGVAWGMALVSLVSVLFWFAPGLVHWGHQGPAQALFSSMLAVWRARWAFLAYGAFWVSAFLASGLLADVLVAAFGPNFAVLIAVPVQLALTCTFYISVYFSFRDCFGAEA